MDQKHGYGIYKWADGKMYEGFWENGKQHGRGKLIGTDGKEKVGFWENGKKVKNIGT